MDPQDPASFNHRKEQLSTGKTYHFVDQVPTRYNPKRNPTLLCAHGFPDFWYGWRYQIGPWVRKGCRVVVPDMLGYGATDKPDAVSEYSTKKLCADLAALLDLLGIEKAVLIGHDWGAFIVGRFALWHPDRLLALVMMSIPFTPPSRQYMSLEDAVKLAPSLGYQLFFAHPDSTTEIEENLVEFFNLIYQPNEEATPYSALRILRSWARTDAPENLNDKEMKYYLNVFKKGGMNGPLNYYRTTKIRYDEEKAAGLTSAFRSDLSCLFLWGNRDSTTTTTSISKAHKFIPRLQDVALDDKGHWILVEAKEEVTEKVIDWLIELSSIVPRL